MNRQQRRLHKKGRREPVPGSTQILQQRQIVCLCCIFKDDEEAPLVERMLASFMPFMAGLACVITGTGKHERLCALIERYHGSALVTSPTTHPRLYHQDAAGTPFFAHFGAARNLSFELAERQEAYDWLCVADADDVLVAGHELQTAARCAARNGIEVVSFPYWYQVNAAPSAFGFRDVTAIHHYERLMRPSLFRWQCRAHERIEAVMEHQVTCATYDYNVREGRTCVWAHFPPERGNRSLRRNLALLTLQLEEEQVQGKEDPYTWYDLGRTHFALWDREGDPMHAQLAEPLLQAFVDRACRADVQWTLDAERLLKKIRAWSCPQF